MQSQHKLTQHILIALLLGALCGLIINTNSLENDWVNHFITDGLLLVIGKWFVALLMVLVVPLVFVSLVKGIASLTDTAKLGKISLWTLTLYVSTTAVAVSTGLILAIIIAPGQRLGLSLEAKDVISTTPSFVEMLISFVPNNPISAMAQGNMLQVIVFALLFGLALSLTAAHKSTHTLMNFFDELDTVILRMVSLVMILAPIGVFALMARSVASQGSDVFLPLLGYFLTVVSALGIHAFITYPLLLKSFTGLSPAILFVKLKDMATFAFSTSSSAATIPVTLATTQRLGVSTQVSGFTIPLGATINMDGTAIMQGVATVFIANAYGISLLPADFTMIIITATLASIGTAAVPGAGLIMLTMVLTQVGLPIEGIALILGVDRLLDMMRTTVNVTGDVVVSVIVADKTDQLDRDQYHKK
jgi:DAACS family dicarboxylate/amino acid:cation (Na+ or H+) symporter